MTLVQTYYKYWF